VLGRKERKTEWQVDVKVTNFMFFFSEDVIESVGCELELQQSHATLYCVQI